jgi:hypothetical protein
MRIDPSELGAEQAYRLITGIVVPRPIAWVTSVPKRACQFVETHQDPQGKSDETTQEHSYRRIQARQSDS